jgi:trimeric autotransporter adhesin
LALFANSTGSSNTAVGASALNNSTGGANTANGALALFNNTSGNLNTAFGAAALYNNTSGSNNTVIGEEAGYNQTTASGNIVLGQGAGGGIVGANNVICIGTAGNDVSDSCYIGNIFGATSSGGTAVFVNSNGRLGTMTSSRRFKEEIQPMDCASEALFSLRPVAFRYKKEIDPTGTPQLGLVAEEVEKVNLNLVVRDKEGKPYSVRYDQVNAMLLNEFLKQHKTVQELKSIVQKQEAIMLQQQKGFESKLAEQEKRIEALTSGLEKVNAHIELSKPRQHTAFNSP